MLKFLNYLFLSYTIIFPVFLKLIGGVDAAGRTQILLAIVILIGHLKNKEFRRIISYSAVAVWGVWGIYTTINWLIKGIPAEAGTFIFLSHSIFLVWMVLVVSAYEASRNYKSLLKVLFYSYLCILLMGLLLQGNIEVDERSGEILGNSMPLNGLCLLFLAVFMYFKKIISSRMLLFVILLALIAAILVATRKALLGIILLSVALIFTKYPIRSFKNFIFFSISLLIVYYSFNYILDNSLVGERMQNIKEDGSDFNTTDIALLNFLGDRAYFYIRGWDFFLDSPLTGIGITNFKNLNIENPILIHSEYMTEIVENGIIGTIIYVMFNFSIIKSIFKSKKQHIIDREYLIFLAWMVLMLFLSFSTWTYSKNRYFFIFGAIIGYIRYKSKNKRYENITRD